MGQAAGKGTLEGGHPCRQEGRGQEETAAPRSSMAADGRKGRGEGQRPGLRGQPGTCC